MVKLIKRAREFQTMNLLYLDVVLPSRKVYTNSSGLSTSEDLNSLLIPRKEDYTPPRDVHADQVLLSAVVCDL